MIEKIISLPELEQRIKETPLDDLNLLDGLTVAYPIAMGEWKALKTKVLPGNLVSIEIMTSCLVCDDEIKPIYLTPDEDGDWMQVYNQQGYKIVKPQLEDMLCPEHVVVVRALGELAGDFLQSHLKDYESPFKFRPPFGKEGQN